MHCCADRPHAGSVASAMPSETGAHGSTLGAVIVIDCVHGTPEHIRPGAIAPSAVQPPPHAGESHAIDAAPMAGHFAADTCISSGSAHPADMHEHSGHLYGEGCGSAWSSGPAAGAFSGQGG